MDYQEFISAKSFRHVDAGFDVADLPYPLFDYQAPIVKWALKRGKAAIFADTGFGKTIMQLAWADQVAKHTGCPVLILAPLAVSNQTIEEGAKYGIRVEKANPGAPMFGPHVVITNYEQLHKFSPDVFQGVVLDESSILKGMDGRRRKEITEFAQSIPYRLSCTATPSPNDFMELGTQSEFLGIMSQVEMLAMFFIHDGGDVAKWRLKGHGQSKFFQWLATWAIVIRKPDDLGFDGSRHALPELVYHSHVIETEPEDSLFVEPAQGLQDRNKARKDSVRDRVAKAAEIANGMDGHVLIWCHLNEESELLTRAIAGSVEVKGSDAPEHKELAAKWFVGKNVTVLNGRLYEESPCRGQKSTHKQGSKNTKTILNTEKSESLNLEIQIQEKNTCESTQQQTEKNLEGLQSSRPNTTESEGSDTHQIANTEIEKRQKSLSISEQTQKKDLPIDLENMGSLQINMENFCHHKAADAQFADAQTQDAKNKSGFMLTTAMQQGESEDCFAQTATRVLESSKTPLICSIQQLDTSRRVLISKPRIFGYGLNFQNCHQMIFVGLSDSWESYYQAIRRCWRFGQTKPVHVHIVSADTEGAVIENIKRKDEQNKVLGEKMVEHMKTMMDRSIFAAATTKTEYNPQIKMELPQWLA